MPADTTHPPEKVEHGRFYTAGNPFDHPAVHAWLDTIPPQARWLEPYAGANHLVDRMRLLRPDSSWTSFDLAPAHPDVQPRDTIASFPVGYDVVVTNPPYLAKNAAARRKMDDAVARMGQFDNLYKRCLDDCLTHSRWVAAIVPEQLVGADRLHRRLTDIVSLPSDRMFDDTDQPTCLALWQPTPAADPVVWRHDRRLGRLTELLGARPQPDPDGPTVTFNRPDGQVGLLAVDTSSRRRATFVAGSRIDPAEVVPTGRHRTRIHVDGLRPADVGRVVDSANRRLQVWRDRTGDVGLTAFRGLRADGRFRRRVDFTAARALLQAACRDL